MFITKKYTVIYRKKTALLQLSLKLQPPNLTPRCNLAISTFTWNLGMTDDYLYLAAQTRCKQNAQWPTEQLDCQICCTYITLSDQCFGKCWKYSSSSKMAPTNSVFIQQNTSIKQTVSTGISVYMLFNNMLFDI